MTANGYENLTTAPKGEQALKIICGEGEEAARPAIPDVEPRRQKDVRMRTRSARAEAKSLLADVANVKAPRQACLDCVVRKVSDVVVPS